MLALSLLRSHVNYYLEGIFVNRINIKIERFDLNKQETDILVIYRIGRQKLVQKLILSEFSAKYFENLSGYDRQRISKFAILQDLLVNLFPERDAARLSLINYITRALKHDQLF